MGVRLDLQTELLLRNRTVLFQRKYRRAECSSFVSHDVAVLDCRIAWTRKREHRKIQNDVFHCSLPTNLLCLIAIPQEESQAYDSSNNSCITVAFSPVLCKAGPSAAYAAPAERRLLGYSRGPGARRYRGERRAGWPRPPRERRDEGIGLLRSRIRSAGEGWLWRCFAWELERPVP